MPTNADRGDVHSSATGDTGWLAVHRNISYADEFAFGLDLILECLALRWETA